MLEHEKYGYLELTKKGIDKAKIIYKKHEEIFKFLNLFLGMDEKTSERDACGMEHHVSSKTLDKIIYLMEFIETSPRVILNGFTDSISLLKTAWIKCCFYILLQRYLIYLKPDIL